MQKFLVVSYDNDEQQWFWDFVAALDAPSAVATICKDRPYVIAAEATTPEQLTITANKLETLTIAEVATLYKRVIEEA